MSNSLIQDIEQSQLKTDLPEIAVGDTINVHVRIIEGAKERIQIFEGVVIKIQGTGLTRTMTVRRIVANEGVERTFPLHSPRVSKVEIRRHGDTRRSRLYYLRDRVGKKRRLRDRRRGLASALPGASEAATGKQAQPAAEAASESAESRHGDSPVAS